MNLPNLPAPKQYTLIEGFTEATPLNINNLLKIFKITPDYSHINEHPLKYPILDPTGICSKPHTTLSDEYFQITVAGPNTLNISGGYAILKGVLFEVVGDTQIDITDAQNSYLYFTEGDAQPPEGVHDMVVAMKYLKTEEEPDMYMGIVSSNYYQNNKEDLCVIGILRIHITEFGLTEINTTNILRRNHNETIERQTLYNFEDFIVDGGWLASPLPE